MLSSGYFWWLINIRPGHPVYHQVMTCHMESYLPSRFILKFGYSQLQMGNPSQKLCFQDNLFEEARTWYHFCASSTGARYILLHEMSSLFLSLICYTRYHVANAIMGFCINYDCMKEIEAFYSRKKSVKRTCLKGMDEFLSLKNMMRPRTWRDARGRDEAAIREGEGAEVREAMAKT